MNMKIIFASIAALLAIIGNVPYLIDIFKRRVKPHPYTWLVWSIVSGTVFFGQVAKGAGWGALPFAASEIFTIIIFFFSLRYGFKDIPKRDTYFLVVALLGIIPWILTKDPTLSVVILVTIDVIAFIPTLQKTWRLPNMETPILYSSNVFRHGLALLSLTSYNLATTLHSIAMIVTNTVMTLFVLRGRKKLVLKQN